MNAWIVCINVLHQVVMPNSWHLGIQFQPCLFCAPQVPPSFSCMSVMLHGHGLEYDILLRQHGVLPASGWEASQAQTADIVEKKWTWDVHGLNSPL